MKIIAAHPGPAYAVHDVHAGWVEALMGQGHQVAEYNLGERVGIYNGALVELTPESTREHILVHMEDGRAVKLRKAFDGKTALLLANNGLYSTLYRLDPDLLFVTHAKFYDPEIFQLARKKGTKVVVHHTECPYEDEMSQIEMAANADINLINDPTNLDKFREVNPKTYYFPHSYRPGFHEKRKSIKKFVSDVVFVGTGFPSRQRFMEQIDWTGLYLFLAGNWPFVKESDQLAKFAAGYSCLDNDETVYAYSSSKIGMNLYRKESDPDEQMGDISGWSCGPREIEMAACELFFLREPRGESDELFPMLPSFTAPEEASDLIRWWLSHDDLRQEKAALARASIADRTFKNRAVELMQLLDM